MLKKLAIALDIKTEQPRYQRKHERINQNDQWWPLKLTSPLSCVLFNSIIVIALKDPNTMKKFIVFANTMKKLIVFLGSALITLWLSVRNFNFAFKKKLNEGPDQPTHYSSNIFKKYHKNILYQLNCFLNSVDCWIRTGKKVIFNLHNLQNCTSSIIKLN